MKNKTNTTLLRSLAMAGLCLGIPATTQAGFDPIPLTADCYNQDIIIEASAPGPIGTSTTASMDNGKDNVGASWYEMGYSTEYPDSGLPKAGSVITSLANSAYSFKFAPSYKTNCSMLIDSSAFTDCTFTLTTPTAFKALSFLTSGGNGGNAFNYTVTFQDGTTETGSTNSADWFNGANYAISSRGRVNVQDATFDNPADRYNNSNPRLYSKDITLANSTSPVVSVNVKYKSGTGHTCIMALSGQTSVGGSFTPVDFTGYNADIVVEADAPLPGDVKGYTTATMDNGTGNDGNSWYEIGYDPIAPTTGFPAAGTILTNASAPDHRYAMPADYTINNAIVGNAGSLWTVVLPEPKTYSALSFLSASANGATVNTITVNYQDGSNETLSFTSPNWFNNTPYIMTTSGRVNVGNKALNNVGTTNPRLYTADVVLSNTNSPVVSIDIVSQGSTDSARAAIFAISGNSGAAAPLIATQPTPVQISTGGSATFTVTLQAPGEYTYTWQRGISPTFTTLTDAGTISGSTTDTVSITDATVADDADYQVIIANNAGAITSSVVHLTVISPLTAVTTPTDNITAFGGNTPSGENATHVIDGLTSKYLNFGANGGSPFVGPVGFVVNPSMGRTIVTALRFYTANDSEDRDPADYILAGSNDGGNTYTTISSGPLALPSGRNNGGLSLDPTTQYMQQVLFTNSVGYTTYKVSFTKVKTPASAVAMQIGEVEILGVADTSNTNVAPAILTDPAAVTVYEGDATMLTITASGVPTPTYQWYRKLAGVTNIVTTPDAKTASLSLTTTFADTGDYFCVASNVMSAVTSASARLTVLSTTITNVLTPTDTVVAYGDFSGGKVWGNSAPTKAIDGLTTSYQNGGNGPSATAGFAPFVGPAGVVITQASEGSLVNGLRVYTADSNTERDPANYVVEGSYDGVSFTPIATGVLDLPLARNAGALTIDPTSQPLEEVRFANTKAYSTYRVYFNNTRNDDSAACLQFGEIELLGVASKVVVSPVMGVVYNSDKTLTFTSTVAGTLQSATVLKGTATEWTDEGPISGSLKITPSLSTPAMFYRIVVK
jgi:hypothetical protein